MLAGANAVSSLGEAVSGRRAEQPKSASLATPFDSRMLQEEEVEKEGEGEEGESMWSGRDQ